jgi:hypothetical protein
LALCALFLTGCLESAEPSELSCTEDRYCPSGYLCVGARPGLPGACQKPKDAAAQDAPAGSTDVADFDGLGDAGDALDDGDLRGPQGGRDSARDTAMGLDQSVSIDTLVGPDAPAEVPSPRDLGFETLSDTPI